MPVPIVGETAARSRHEKGTSPVHDATLPAPRRPVPPCHRFVSRAPRGTIAILGLLLVVAGCSRTQAPKMPLTPGAPDPVAEAKSLLEAYGGGQPLGSESVNYEDLINRVTAVDAAKGAKLKAFAEEAVGKGKVDPAKAKKLAAEL